MDLSSAFSIYNLPDSKLSREDIDRSFKKLVKKYHPDRNQKYADWCHERMTEINEAYEILMGYVEADLGSDHRGSNSSGGNRKNESSRESDYGSTNFFRKAAKLFFEGVHTYYDYELTKRSLRQEGVWKYHYRRAVKMMNKALDEWEKRITAHPEDREEEKFLYFGRLFLADIEAQEPQIPRLMGDEKTHIAYREAVNSIDKAFSGFFSAERGAREKHLAPLYRASHLLILLVENYPQTEWYNLALQKLNLLDSFLDLQDLFRTGKITF